MTAADGPAQAGSRAQRLDKWLWFARIAKSRTLAAGLVTGGKIRVNRTRALKPAQLVKAGDVITSAAAKTVRILRVLAPGERRGPATEAARLYEELTPAAADLKSPTRTAAWGERPGMTGLGDGRRTQGAGRPTKRDRRQTDFLKGRGL
jgi:ribosome-associated heat shock protein Hsp15